jgi:predicted nucleic acid-binding protein
LAIAGGANYNYIVTGDIKHLLPLKSYRGIKILSPAAFVTLKVQ